MGFEALLASVLCLKKPPVTAIIWQAILWTDTLKNACGALLHTFEVLSATLGGMITMRLFPDENR